MGGPRQSTEIALASPGGDSQRPRAMSFVVNVRKHLAAWRAIVASLGVVAELRS
jgi:hypothetical protein